MLCSVRAWGSAAVAATRHPLRRPSSLGFGRVTTPTALGHVRCASAASAASSGAAPPGGAAPRGSPGLVGLSGAPLTSTGPAGTDTSVGAEVDLTPQNAAQILQSAGAFVLQAGSVDEATEKKINRLRVAAGGRLTRARVDCGSLPQVCQALQIRSEPTVLLMARGQVAAALEGQITPQATTAFVERVAQLLGLKVDLGGSSLEQLAEAEDLEWSDAVAADEAFARVSETADLTMEARIRAAAGRVRCALRAGQRQDAEPLLRELEAGGHARSLEVKQAAAMLHLDKLRSSGTESLQELQATAASQPSDVGAATRLAVALFWSAREGEAVDCVLALARASRTEEARKLALAVIEALGPRHARSKPARRALSNAFFA